MAINFQKLFKQNESEKPPEFKKLNSDLSPSSFLTLPFVALKDIVVFPYMIAPVFVGRSKSIKAVSNAMKQSKKIFLGTQKKADIDSPAKDDMGKIGTIAKVLQILRLPDGTLKILVEGESRARLVNFVEKEDYIAAEIEHITEDDVPEVQKEALCRTLMESFKDYAELDSNVSAERLSTLSAVYEPSRLADTISSQFAFRLEDKLKILEAIPIDERVLIIIGLIKLEIEVFEVNKRIKGRVKDQIDKSQKNYYLNEQMRAIRKEMGDDDEEIIGELKELEEEINKKKMSEEATEKVKKELKKLKMMPPLSAEGTVVRNYIDWIISLPWFECSEVNEDIEEAEKILNEDHFGLEKPKERILEYLAVQLLVKKVKGPILCLVGPPGVGKTSLAKSVSRATGRKYTRISLGGLRDEAEIRGHRKTYIGALPGKIIQSLKKVGVNNPVLCLDEVDKMSNDFRGDPSSALLEVLDPEQNNAFNDHYLEIDYDLSDILFITTANTLPDIPLPLQDRMEIIRLPGYTEYEKYYIAKDFLISKQIKLNGLEGRDVRFSKNAIFKIIRRYTREAGVRGLEREIASICRKIAMKVLKEEKDGKDKVYKVSSGSLQGYLGTVKFKEDQIEEEDQIGMVTGLAWTQVGGELLCIETLIIPGKGNLILTGKLGDVMQESSKAAVSYVRSIANTFSIDQNFHKKYDIHIHLPEGAIPKDGPSAGISMCSSIISALTKKPVRKDLAMTGEITLRGRVLPIGGLKEKILAARRGGIKKVIIPQENEKDLKEIPSSVLKKLNVVTVNHMDQVLNHVFTSDKPKKKKTVK